MNASSSATTGALAAARIEPLAAVVAQPLNVTVMIRSMGRPTLQRALASVAAQTHDALSVLVVNAGGGQHPELGLHCGRFPLDLINQGGLALDRPVAANRALDAAQGDALMFLDDDDAIDPEHVQRLCEALAGPPAAEVAYAGVRLVNAQGEVTGELDAPFDSLRLWMGNYLPIHAPLFLRRLVQNGARFDESMPVYEDWDFWRQLSRRTRFVHVPGVSASYHLVGDSGLTVDPNPQRTREGRLQFYGKWLPAIDAASLERLAALADAQRGLSQQQQHTHDALEAALRQARQAAEEAEHKRAGLGHEVAAALARLQAAEQALHAGYGREVHLTAQLEKLQGLHAQAQEQLRAHEAQLLLAVQAQQALQAQLQAAGLERANLQVEQQALTLSLQAAQSQVHQQSDQANELHARLAQANEQAAAAEHRAAQQWQSLQAAFAAQAERLQASEQQQANAQTAMAAHAQQIEAAQRAQADLTRQIQAHREGYSRLESGYREVTGSLSWRITAPLRAVRSVLSAEGLHRSARRAARGTMLALPISNDLKDRVKLNLATRDTAWARSILRLLAHPMARPVAHAPSTTPAQPVPAEPALVIVSDKERVRAMAEAELTTFLGSDQRVQFAPASAQPKVSVVVVLFNQAGLSLRCLQALAASTGADFEVLIVDNRSTDRVPQMLGRVDGAKVIRHDDNLGFLRAVNDAAEHARGEYLLLLNNDAEVFPDTLERAVHRLEIEPTAGAVGGPIYLWDGKLQEAGSIVWNDGSCLGYGRGDEPGAAPYRFLRDVDYCSGALLLIRRALFEGMGRFDMAFAPAYYEESDFCVRLWEAGHRVVYDPAVRVRHFEFASQTASTQALELQARNQKVFRARHLDYLGERPQPAIQNIWRARLRLPPGAQRILFIDDRVPFPWIGQGFPRACDLIHSLNDAGHFVTLYPLQFPEEDWRDIYRALPERVEVMVGEGLAGLPRFLESRKGSWDLMVVSRPHNMQVISALREQHSDWFEGLPIAYDAEALFTLRDVAKAALRGTPIEPERQQQMLQAELALSAGADCVMAVSETEAGHYRAHRPGKADTVHVLGHAVQPSPTAAGFDSRHGFLFVGAMAAEDTPNTDSVLWFLREVWPHITAELGAAAQLDLVGACHSDEIRALASPQVRIHGQVPDVGDWYARARVLVVPTRYAAGIPHKAHEGASRGVPIVTTPLIAGQLGWRDELLASDDPAGFARHCLALHADSRLWQQKRQALLRAIERDCSPAAFSHSVAQVVDSLMAQRGAAQPLAAA